jgi:hypothetical protein
VLPAGSVAMVCAKGLVWYWMVVILCKSILASLGVVIKTIRKGVGVVVNAWMHVRCAGESVGGWGLWVESACTRVMLPWRKCVRLPLVAPRCVCSLWGECQGPGVRVYHSGLFRV